MSEETLSWVEANDGYSVAFDQGKIICKNSKDKILKSLPSKVRNSEIVQDLRQLTDWLKQHEQDCIETVDGWMLRSLPVPRPVLESVWADPAWRRPLENAIVAPVGFDPEDDEESIGFFRGADPDKGIGIVNLDGETTWLDMEALTIPHPVLLPDLGDFRELATELDITQGLSQLFRETFTRDADISDDQKSLNTFANGKFEQLNWALGKCRTMGYRVRGGFATCPVFEATRKVEARFWIGSDYPEYETFTGELVWVDGKERSIPIGDVGPVAFSEGMRMASSIYAARSKDEEEETN